MDISESVITVSDRSVRVLQCGPDAGELVVLLHGFPELADSWQHQLRALGQAGYRAIAPDQRGYGGSDKAGPFDVDTLAGDIVDLIHAVNHTEAVVVGHDWGGGVAWTLASRRPESVTALVAANCPPPAVLAHAMTRSFKQLRKSWYMFFFQIPRLPEYWLTRDNSAEIARSLVGGSHVRTAFSDADLEHYRDAFSRPGAAEAAIGWYRAALRSPKKSTTQSAAKITAPTLVVWGVKDQFLGAELVSPKSLATVMAAGNVPTVRFIGQAGHFVQNEAPADFNAALLNWLAERPGN
ncbi:MAG: alpha/beta fold hydrolase [Candidatus Nanopelagicales bacterium]